MQIAPEGTAQTQASAGAAGLPDGTNGGNDTNVNSGKKRGKLIGLLAAAAVLIAAVIGISIYNAPSNRMNRALDLGACYLEEQNYEQALVEFDKVIAIDPMNTAAYLGKAQAYEGMGDTEQMFAVLQTGYEQTGDEQIKAELSENYLEQASGYEESADYESALAVYDKLQELDGEDQKVQDSLSGLLVKQAADYAASGDYDGALAVYDKLLETAGEDPEVQKGLQDFFNGYFRKLIDEGNYDEVKSLVEKYRDKAPGVDFQMYLDEIEEMEEIANRNYLDLPLRLKDIPIESYDTFEPYMQEMAEQLGYPVSQSTDAGADFWLCGGFELPSVSYRAFSNGTNVIRFESKSSVKAIGKTSLKLPVSGEETYEDVCHNLGIDLLKSAVENQGESYNYHGDEYAPGMKYGDGNQYFEDETGHYRVYCWEHNYGYLNGCTRGIHLYLENCDDGKDYWIQAEFRNLPIDLLASNLPEQSKWRYCGSFGPLGKTVEQLAGMYYVSGYDLQLTPYGDVQVNDQYRTSFSFYAW